MNDAARAQLEKDIERQTTEAERFQQDAQAEINELQQELQNEFQKKLLPILEQIANEKGLQVLFSAADAGHRVGHAGPRPDRRRRQEARRDGQARRDAASRSHVDGDGSGFGHSATVRIAISPRIHRHQPHQPLPCVRDQHPHRSSTACATGIRRCSSTRSPSTRPGRRLVAVKNVTVNEEFFQGHFPGRAADARRADARVAVAGGGDPAAAARGRAAQRARLPARRQRRQVPPAGRARRSAAARDLARPAARARWRARRRPPTSAIRSSPRPSCCSAWCRTAPRSIRPPSSTRARRSAQGTTIGPHADDRPARAHRRQLPDRRVGGHRRLDRDRRRHARSIPFASIGLIPQDLKFRGEETRLVDRQAATSSASS